MSREVKTVLAFPRVWREFVLFMLAPGHCFPPAHITIRF
jgi:hypothetical protein